MNPFNSLIFGMGLFFLGLQLVGDNLRKLIGVRFREVIKRCTHSRILSAGLGTGAGALLQSATAVTFILVSMTSTGLISSAAAAPVIIWGNVGTTALAFVVNLNIHPYAAFVVGGAGIALGMIRKPTWRATAGALLGLGLILIGLEQMGAGAGPLKHAEWFRSSMNAAAANPLLAFAAGIGAAVILQSNSGAALLVITLGASGAIPFSAALLMIYGTNLGTIGLRSFLATGLQGEQFRLVMLENFFCLIGGILLLSLYGIELLGIPLVIAFLESLSVSLNLKLAGAFLISNLLPAIAISPFLGPSQKLLKKMWPDKSRGTSLAEPLYLHPNALDDPPGALDLISRELSRLLASIKISPPSEDITDEADKDFTALASAIEAFANKLTTRNSLDEAAAQTLHLERAELSIIRHIEESVRYYSATESRKITTSLFDQPLSDLLALATKAASDQNAAEITELKEKTKIKAPYISSLQIKVTDKSTPLAATAAFEDFAAVVWSLHRLAKLLPRKNLLP